MWNSLEWSVQVDRWAAGAMVWCVLLIPLAGCSLEQGGPVGEGQGWIDLVALFDDPDKQVLHHDDQTFVGVGLGEERVALSVAVDLDHPMRVVLGGGFSGAGGKATAEGTLRYRLEGDGTELAAGAIGLDKESWWWRHVIDLPPRFVGAVTVSIEAEVPEGHTVVLRDMLIEQRVARALESVDQSQILLISVDTLREDALGVYGAPWDTPNLDRFTEEGERWFPHYSGAGWTKPSHAVMLTGYRGDTHQMSQKERVMDPGVPTLAERLRAKGFKTAGFVYNCKWLDPKWGFDRGFEEYHVSDWRVARAVFHVSNWIEGHRDDPFFLFFHTFEPHSDFHRLPYESPGTTPAELSGRFGVSEYGCREGRCASQRLNDLNDGAIEPLPNETEILRFLYGRGVQEIDRALGELFSDLRRKGLWDDLLIIVTSDHGEAFYEHGRYLHGLTWNEIVRVPLLIKWPKGRNSGRVRTLPSGSIDIAPTLLEHAGLELGDLPGTPLQHLEVERPIYIGGPNRMIVQGDWKAILPGSLSGVRFLSNIREDRNETKNLVEDRVETAQELFEIARAFTRHDIALREKFLAQGIGGSAALTEEETAKLKALGYLE